MNSADPSCAFSAQVTVHKLSTDFRAATRLETATVPAEIPAGKVLVRFAYAGCNARCGRHDAAVPLPASDEFISAL